MTERTEFRAAQLAHLLRTEVFDTEDAAKLLDIERGSLDYAAYRLRIAHVRLGAKKLFCRLDLEDYRAKRDRGAKSQLGRAPVYIVKE